MLSLQDYTSHDGLGLADLVARKEVKPEELLEAALSAVEKVNPKINAVLQTLPDQARAAIRQGLPQGPFQGVPFLIKELVLHAKNVRCDMGSRLAQGMMPPEDTELMARFRRAGLLLAGTTQTPELGYNPTTETVLFGPVHNPWDLGRSAGGSSGGSGAAVAAGIVPIAHANDGGGSIRIPASCDGLVGLKPTRDRTPTGPDYSDPLCGLAIEFVVTRSVRDAAALLDAVAGPDVGAPSHPVPPARPWREAIGAKVKPMRIAWTVTPASGQRVDPECEKAVHETVRTLKELGHTVFEDAPRYDWDTFLKNVHVIWTGVHRALRRRSVRRDRPQAGARHPRGRDARLLRRRQAIQHARPAQFVGPCEHAVAPGGSVLREDRRAGDSDHRAPAGAARRARSESQGHDGDGLDAAGVRVRAVHAALQLDRPAGRVAAAPLERRRLADRGADRRPIRRRNHDFAARRAARASAAMEGQAPEGPCRRGLSDQLQAVSFRAAPDTIVRLARRPQ